MKVLLLGDARVLSSCIASKGHQITLDPGDRADVTVSDVMTCEFAPEAPLIVMATGTVADWATRQKRPDAQIVKEASMVLEVLDTYAFPALKTLSGASKPLVLTYSNKGGVGKTTAATSIALVLASSGLKTVICDFNIAAPDIATFFNLKPKYGLEDAIKDLEPALIKVSDNLWALPGPIGITTKRFEGDDLVRIIKELQEKFDVVIVDTPPEPWTKGYIHKIFSYADIVYAVVDQSSYSIQETRVFAPTLIAMGVQPSKIRIIVNKFNPKLSGVKEIEKAFCAGFKKDAILSLPKVEVLIPDNWEKHVQAGYSSDILYQEKWLKLAEEIAKMSGHELKTDSVKKNWKWGLLNWLKK